MREPNACQLYPVGAHYFTTHRHDILACYSTKVNKVPLGVGSFLSQ